MAALASEVWFFPLFFRRFAAVARLRSPGPSAQLHHPARLVPVRDINIRIPIDKAPMRRAERSRSNALWLKIVIRPLLLIWIVPQKRNRHIVSIEHRYAPLQLRHDRIIPMQRDLARPP